MTIIFFNDITSTNNDVLKKEDDRQSSKDSIGNYNEGTGKC